MFLQRNFRTLYYAILRTDRLISTWTMAAALVPAQFRPSKSFNFPKREFGSKGEKRSFRAEWCQQFEWLHYDVGKDAAFCYLCMKCQLEKKFLASTKRDPAFISRGFTYWKEGTTSFKKHTNTECHREAVEALIVLPQCCKDVGELQSAEHAAEKARNRQVFMLILSNLRFLARQGLAMRGDGKDSNSNFMQLFRLRCLESTGVDVDNWLARRLNKYTSPEVQNECLQLMALHILRDVSSKISASSHYSILADECTDCSNKEQFTVNIRWIDEELKDHESFIGLYQVDSIDAVSLLVSIKDVLLRMNVQLSHCRGQCYDGASNMSGARNGVATKILEDERRALYTHCYAHSLNLAVSDTMKKSRVCRDALDIAFEITRLIKFSPKREAAFEKIRSSQQDDLEFPTPVGIRALCPTRWTVRGDSLESILLNYEALLQLWDECLESRVRLDPDIKARIIGVKSVMTEFRFVFGLKVSEVILKMTDNLSRTLQKSSISAAEAQHLASLSVATLQGMRTTETWTVFYASVEALQQKLGVSDAVLPRKRKAPKRHSDGSEGFHSETPQDMYRVAYFEAVDLAIATIKDRFDQPGYAMYRSLEDLLLKAVRGLDYSIELQSVCSLYTEIDASSLKVQLTNLATKFATESSVSLREILDYIHSLSSDARCFFKEVCCVVSLITVMPASNAVSERSFSTMRRIKSYLRSTMSQSRLNHLMVLNIYKEELGSLDMVAVANEFVTKNEHRSQFFGKFS